METGSYMPVIMNGTVHEGTIKDETFTPDPTVPTHTPSEWEEQNLLHAKENGQIIKLGGHT